MPRGLQVALMGAAAWTPLKLGSALVAWWDASYGITESGGLVSSWKDRIGQYDIAQSSGSLKPVYSATAINGQPGVTFDGVDDYMVLAPVPAAFPLADADGAIMALIDQTRLGSDGGTASIGGYGSGAVNGGRVFDRWVSSGNNRFRVTNQAVTAPNTSVDFSGPCAVGGLFTATAFSDRANGVTTGTTSSAQTTANTRIRLAAGTSTSVTGYLQGSYGHFLVVSGALSTADLERLEAWLLWSVGQQAKLPSTHTYRNRRP
jgi:hypothetical protein